MIEILIADAVIIGKDEIREDIEAGWLPAGVRCFSDLHDHCDANEYGGLTEDYFAAAFPNDGKSFFQAAAEVQETLDQWIKAGMPDD